MFFNYLLAVRASCFNFSDLLLENIPFYINLAKTCTEDVMKEYLVEAFYGLVKYNSELRHGVSTRCVKSLTCNVNSISSNIPHGVQINHAIYWKLKSSSQTFNVNAIMLGYDGKVYNYYNTHEELLKTLEETDTRIKAEPLRILRYFRFEYEC